MDFIPWKTKKVLQLLILFKTNKVSCCYCKIYYAFKGLYVKYVTLIWKCVYW